MGDPNAGNMYGASFAPSYGYNTQATTMAPPAAMARSFPQLLQSSVYGEHRPTFSEDGKGAPYSTMPDMSNAVNQDVSYDTCSKDPHMVRARVFVGNLSRAMPAVTRDEIIEHFRPFGTILACAFFNSQGFGFVQYSEAKEADLSCLKLNQTKWKNCFLDVHLAMLGATRPKRTAGTVEPVPVAPLPVPKESETRKRSIEEDDDTTAAQNKRNRTSAISDVTSGRDLTTNEMADTLICGNCRFVSCDFDEFKEHRIVGCKRYRDPDEPSHRLKCATCSQRFLSAWGLLEHLTDFHRMLLYKEEIIEKPKQTSEPRESSQPPPTQPYFTPIDSDGGNTPSLTIVSASAEPASENIEKSSAPNGCHTPEYE